MNSWKFEKKNFVFLNSLRVIQSFLRIFVFDNKPRIFKL